jgi:hypothetical protein
MFGEMQQGVVGKRLQQHCEGEENTLYLRVPNWSTPPRPLWWTYELNIYFYYVYIYVHL